MENINTTQAGVSTGSLNQNTAMSFSFDVARVVGTDAAIILSNIQFWVAKNKANDKHFYNGRYWTYNSIKAYEELFPYLTGRQIRRCIDKLEGAGYLLTGEFNKKGYDRTKWYSPICPNGQMDLTKRSNGLDQTVKPIPDINTDINTYSNRGLQEPKTKAPDNTGLVGVRTGYADRGKNHPLSNPPSGSNHPVDAEGTSALRNNIKCLKNKSISTSEPKNKTLEAYYYVVNKHQLPITNNKNLAIKARALERELGEGQALDYLRYLVTGYLEPSDDPYKPTLNESLDIYSKRKSIQNWKDKATSKVETVY